MVYIVEVASFCFDDGFAQSWHSLNQLHEVLTWNGFPKPSHLALRRVFAEARPSDAALRYSPSWSIALTQPGGMWSLSC